MGWGPESLTAAPSRKLPGTAMQQVWLCPVVQPDGDTWDFSLNSYPSTRVSPCPRDGGAQTRMEVMSAGCLLCLPVAREAHRADGHGSLSDTEMVTGLFCLPPVHLSLCCPPSQRDLSAWSPGQHHKSNPSSVTQQWAAFTS